MDDERLIELVRALGELYDCNHKKYCDSAHKTKLWIGIGKKMRHDPQRCKQRWESLRSQFRKFLRCKKVPAGQAGNAYPPKWRYERQLQFLIPHMKDKLRVTSMLGESEGSAIQVKQEDEESVAEEDEPPILEESTALTRVRAPQNSPRGFTSKRRKLLSHTVATPSGTLARYVSGQIIKPSGLDEMDLFFETMKATINKFSEPDKFLAKQRVFQVISEIETKQIHEQCFAVANQPAPFQQEAIYSDDDQEDGTSTISTENISHYSPSPTSPAPSENSMEPQEDACSPNDASYLGGLLLTDEEEDIYEDP